MIGDEGRVPAGCRVVRSMRILIQHNGPHYVEIGV
jgi:hypothetical protein